MGGAGEAGHAALQLMHCHLTETNARGAEKGEKGCTCVCRETFKFKPKIVADVATVPLRIRRADANEKLLQCSGVGCEEVRAGGEG